MTCLQRLQHSLACTVQHKRLGEKWQRVVRKEKGKRIPWQAECVQQLLLGVSFMEGSSFKWGSMGIATLFALFILHFWRIESIYCTCPIEIVLFSWLCSILMPTILEGSPISVISKRFCNSAFRHLIMSGILVNSNRSSTHTVMISILPVLCLIYTHGSECNQVKSCCISFQLNSSFHLQPNCFNP